MTAEPDSLGVDDSAALAALERFVVESDDLLALESLIGRFNIFDALRIARAEIRHSNFLAFLLDPAESHGQGQLFLKAVLMDLLKNALPELRPLSPIELDGVDLRGVEVKREWKHIDLLIACQAPKFILVIENKVDSAEHSDQLKRYEDAVEQNYPNSKPLYVFLTLPDGEEPSREKWLPYSYEDIHRVLNRVRDSYRNAIGDDVLAFLDHYLDLIGTRFMNNPKIDELCQRIYKNHRQALDLIWEHGGSPESAALDEAEDVLKEDGNWHVFYRSSRCLEFVPRSWTNWLPPFGLTDDKRFWIIVIFRLKKDKIQYQLQAYETVDGAKRREIVTKLREECSRIGLNRSKVGGFGKIARICANKSILEWAADDKPEPEAIRTAVKKTLDDLSPQLEKLASVLKPLCKVPASAG